MSVDHYENFPVASFLLPAHLRPAVVDIYRFARTADDIADEGDATDPERLAGLMRFKQGLDGLQAQMDAPGSPMPPADEMSGLFERLGQTVRRHALPLDPFHRLLDAFMQDVRVKRYADYTQLLDYCSRSANPVGELMLRLYGKATDINLRHSDAICTALQLANFWQDVAIDRDKQRIYVPLEDLHRFGVSEEDLIAGRCNDAWRKLMSFEVERTRALLHFGSPLARQLPGRPGWELRLVIQGGLRILERIEAVEFDVFRARPKLGKGDWIPMLWRALRMPRPPISHHDT